MKDEEPLSPPKVASFDYDPVPGFNWVLLIPMGIILFLGFITYEILR